MRNLLFFVFLFLVCACGDSEFTKFNNRIIVMETLSKTGGLSSNVLSSYIDSIAIIKAQISLSKVEEKYKDSLNSKLNLVYDDLRASRGYNCIKDKTLRKTNTINNRGDKVRTKIEFISKDSVSISHTYEMSDTSAYIEMLAALTNKSSKIKLPKNNTHNFKISWIAASDDDSYLLAIISSDEDKKDKNDPSVIKINDVKCTYNIEL